MLTDVGGYRLAATVRGNGPSAVFVSGLGEPGANWEPVLQRLTGPVRRITYDRAGIAGSDAAVNEHGPQPYRVVADELGRLLDRLGASSPLVLVGHSFGCLVARVFATRYPGRVGGLVLVEGSLPAMALWPGDGGPYADGDRSDARWIDADAGACEMTSLPGPVPAVVLTRTPGRWTSPQATADLDRSWRTYHERLAAELDARHLMAIDGGHRLNAEAPALVALAVDAVAAAAVGGGSVLLPADAVDASGGRLIR
ncbi:hypothetical protein GCM10009682_23950 [Luedemannella flava]|uniref:AB hydrolase-1 domain-containing protein n=1 Tax=Luedemannella flava TaxID=349316 RepID=A0ABN2LWI0_9ACTN